jgi:transglutaminase-like putative cysteine protease
MNNTEKTKKYIRWWDWLAAFFLIIMLQIAAGRLIATQWTKYLNLVIIVTFLGTILGLALGKSIFNRFWAIFLAFAYGIILIPWQLGLTLDSQIEWLVRVKNLWGRLSVVIDELITRKPVTDSILFLLSMAVLFWVIAVYSGFTLVREANPWKVVIPGGIAAFVIHSFDPLLVSRSWYLAFYLFFALLLVARLEFIKNSAQWKQRHTHTPPDMSFDVSRVAIILTMLLVFFAWNVPVLAQSFQPVADIWHTASKPWLSAKDRFSFMFASLRASVGIVQNFYGNTMALGLGSPLSDQVVMDVQGPSSPPNGARLYWEARTYDTYSNSQWSSSIKTTRDLTPDSVDLNQPGADVRPDISFTFFTYGPISNLFVVSEPLSVNLSAQAIMAVNPDGTVNFTALMSKGIIRPGEQYTVKSAMDAMTVKDLKDAGSTYPQWVLDEYLQLPDTITPRTHQLAKDISSGLTSEYDIANAVTQYLRDNITYNQSVSQPPPNQERIDWFLFDYKQGFCNYYASADVVLLRSLGIPARLAVGFAQGQREIPPIPALPPGASREEVQALVSETATYVVRQKDAHAWPEVFFPGIGWVAFEPTVSQPALFRPSGEISINPNPAENGANQAYPTPLPGVNDRSQQTDGANGSSSEAGGSFWTLGNIVKLFFILAVVILLVVIIWQVRRGFKLMPFLERVSIDVPEGIEKGLRRLGIHPPHFLTSWVSYMKLPALSRSYQEINHALHRIGRKPDLQDTPSERAASLISNIPASAAPVERLLYEYQTSIYSPRTADPDTARQAGSEIRKLSWIARLGRLLARFQEPDRKK